MSHYFIIINASLSLWKVVQHFAPQLPNLYVLVCTDREQGGVDSAQFLTFVVLAMCSTDSPYSPLTFHSNVYFAEEWASL